MTICICYDQSHFCLIQTYLSLSFSLSYSQGEKLTDSYQDLYDDNKHAKNPVARHIAHNAELLIRYGTICSALLGFATVAASMAACGMLCIWPFNAYPALRKYTPVCTTASFLSVLSSFFVWLFCAQPPADELVSVGLPTKASVSPYWCTQVLVLSAVFMFAASLFSHGANRSRIEMDDHEHTPFSRMSTDRIVDRYGASSY
jgi:hypothetical protein